MLLKIGNTDVSSKINESSYKMDESALYEEWIDGNYITHRTQTRTKITGMFDIVFLTDADMKAFLDLVEEHTTDNVTKLTAWITNLGQAKEIDCYLQILTSKMAKISDTYTLNKLTIGVEER